MADARSPDSSGKTYFPDYIIQQGDPVRSAWLDMLKKNADDVLYTGLTEPLAKAGYEDVGAALAAVPSAINEFVLPSELGAWVPMMGGIKKVTKLPTAAKEPVINPPQTNEVLRAGLDQGNFILPDELQAERVMKEPFLDRMNKVAKELSSKVQEAPKNRDYMTKYPFVEDAVVEFRNITDPSYMLSGEKTNRDFVKFLIDNLNKDSEFLNKSEVMQRRIQIDEISNRLKRDEGLGAPFKGG